MCVRVDVSTCEYVYICICAHACICVLTNKRARMVQVLLASSCKTINAKQHKVERRPILFSQTLPSMYSFNQPISCQLPTQQTGYRWENSQTASQLTSRRASPAKQCPIKNSARTQARMIIRASTPNAGITDGNEHDASERCVHVFS